MRLLAAVGVVLSVLLLVACGTAQPQAFTIGVINPVPQAQPIIDDFKAGMAGLGYVEEVNVVYFDEEPVGLEGLDARIQNVVEADVDLILTGTTLTVQKVKQATEGLGMPVVFFGVYDPVRSGVVESLIRPGGNLTGVRLGGGIPKQLELLLAVTPGLMRLFLLHNPDDDASVQGFVDLQRAAANLGIELVVSEVRTTDEVLLALDSMPEEVDAFFNLPSGFISVHMPTIVEFAIERQLPLTSQNTLAVHLGAIMSYGPDFSKMGKQVSRMAVKILDGTVPADLPVETADFFLAINLETVEAIGIDIPDEILRQADEIIR